MTWTWFKCGESIGNRPNTHSDSCDNNYDPNFPDLPEYGGEKRTVDFMCHKCGNPHFYEGTPRVCGNCGTKMEIDKWVE